MTEPSPPESPEPAPEPVVEPPPAPEPPAPVQPPNKLHEWAAAVTIIVVLLGLSYMFISLLRSARM